MAGSSQPALDLRVDRRQLDIMINNRGVESVRIWDRSNSWGWQTLALNVAGSSSSDGNWALTAKPRSWTRNGPGFIEIAAGGSHLVMVAAGDPEWDGIELIEHLRGETLRVRANLRIPPSPEAGTYGVFVGAVNSPWRESRPPHLWLFTDS